MSDEERAARYSDLFAGSHEHGSDCAYCPICATIAIVRKTKPEIVDHLAAAARELIAAAALVLEEAGEVIGADGDLPAGADRSAGSKAGKVRRIDIA